MSSIRSASSRTRISRSIELRVREAEVVEQASRRRDRGRRRPCGTRAPAAPCDTPPKTARRGQGRVDRQRLRVLLDLRRELARRRQDERARHAALLADQVVEDRQQERGRLAAAGHGAGEDVAALHGGRDGVGLDGRGAREAHFAHAAQKLRVKSELGKRQGNPPMGIPAVCRVGNGGLPAGLRSQAAASAARERADCHSTPAKANRLAGNIIRP